MTDTKQEYVDGLDFYVQMAGETDPDFVDEYWERRIEDEDDPAVGRDDSPLRDHHQLNEEVPIDGEVYFYFPDRLNDPEESGVWSFSFPFRDHREDDYPWFAYPDREKWERHPVWKWKNPDEDPHEDLTLRPSLGIGDPITFHCYIRQGEVDWL